MQGRTDIPNMQSLAEGGKGAPTSYSAGTVKFQQLQQVLHDLALQRHQQVARGPYPPSKEQSTGKVYGEWICSLLRRLSVSAPALRSLDMLASREDSKGKSPWIGPLLPLIGALSQLETLVLRTWD